MFEHTPRRDQNSMDELSVLVSGHPDTRVYDRQFKARMPPHDDHWCDNQCWHNYGRQSEGSRRQQEPN